MLRHKFAFIRTLVAKVFSATIKLSIVEQNQKTASVASMEAKTPYCWSTIYITQRLLDQLLCKGSKCVSEFSLVHDRTANSYWNDLTFFFNDS